MREAPLRLMLVERQRDEGERATRLREAERAHDDAREALDRARGGLLATERALDEATRLRDEPGALAAWELRLHAEGREARRSEVTAAREDLRARARTEAELAREVDARRLALGEAVERRRVVEDAIGVARDDARRSSQARVDDAAED